MDKPVHALSQHEMFVRELLALYKEKPLLWQQNHPSYRNKAERAEAIAVLLAKTQEFYPDADEDFVKMKIDSMRASFRKERKKVLKSKEITSNPEDIHKPSLWYYDLLLFTAGEEAESKGNARDEILTMNNSEDGNSVKIPFWTREHSAILINLYQNQPCLYSATHPVNKSKRRRHEAVRKITEKLISTTGKFFNVEDVRKKISLLRGQFLHEYKKIKINESKGESYKPSLWCFEMLSFLKDEYESQCQNGTVLPVKPVPHMILRRRNKRRDGSSEDSDEDMVDIKKESESPMSYESFPIETISTPRQHDDDIYDTIAKNLAHKLRDMTSKQREIANKLVREIMYHGQMEQLTVNSRLSLDGT